MQYRVLAVAAALATAVTGLASVSAQPPRHDREVVTTRTVVHTDNDRDHDRDRDRDHMRHAGWDRGHHYGWDHSRKAGWHHSRQVCRNEWRHHHRERVCTWRHW